MRVAQIRAPNIPAPIFGEYGAASRSLLACHELVVKGGFTNVVHVVRAANAEPPAALVLSG